MVTGIATRYIHSVHRPSRLKDPEGEVKDALQYLISRAPPSHDSCEGGFYSGTVSIAFLLNAVRDKYPTLELESPFDDDDDDEDGQGDRKASTKEAGNSPNIDESQASLRAWQIAYLDVISKRFKRLAPPTQEHCGISCSLLASLALTTAMTKNPVTAKELCKEIGSALNKDNSSNEWLNGRAGALYLLRFARNSFSRMVDPETGRLIEETDDERSARKTLNRTIEKVILGILDSPRPWKWRGKHYLGAVHGDAGIITQVILSEPGILVDPNFFAPPEGESGLAIDYSSKIEIDIGVLLSYQDENGNWPTGATPGGRTDVVEFCHGAPGIVSSLMSIRDFFDHNRDLRSRIDTAITKGQDLIQRQGLVKKEPCLCHGISGNALALQREEFERFLTYTTPTKIEELQKKYDLEMASTKHKSGLYTGAAGRVWSWVVADEELPLRFLGYNDI